MLRVLLSRVLVVGLMLVAQAAVAQEALDAVGSDAAVVVRVKAPKATIDKVVSFVKEIDPGASQMVRQRSAAIGVGIHNQTLDGVDQSADWWVAVYTGDEGEAPGTVFIIPGTDLKKMKEAVGENYTFVEHGKFGVYSDNEDAVAATKAAIEKKGSSIAKAIDAPSKATFDKGDVSVFVNVGGLVTKYKDKFDMVKESAIEQIDNMPVNPDTGIDPADIVKIAKTMLNATFNGISDSQSFTLALSVSKSGIGLEELLRVKSGSGFDKLLQKSPPSTFDLLGSLPEESQGYMGASFDMAGMLELSSQIVNLVKGDEKTQAALKESFAALKMLKYGPSVASFTIDADSDDGALSAVQLSQITPTDKVRDINRKLAGAQKEVEQKGFKQVMKLEADKETVAGKKVDLLTMKIEPGDDADPTASLVIGNFMTAAFGEEGITQRFAYLPELIVQTIGGGKDLMQSTLEGVQEKGKPSDAMTATRKLLGAKSNLLVLLDIPNLGISLGQAIAESEAVPENILPADAFKGLEADESYFGFSISTEPQGLRFSTVLPVEQVQGIMKIVKKVQSLHE